MFIFRLNMKSHGIVDVDVCQYNTCQYNMRGNVRFLEVMSLDNMKTDCGGSSFMMTRRVCNTHYVAKGRQ